MRAPLSISLALLATPALAADEPPPRVLVTGTASISTPPDRAAIQYQVHGEGATSDEAVAAVVAKRKAIEAGLASLPARPETHAGQLAIVEARSRECNPNAYGRPLLSTGACAIVGYAADLSVDLRTADVRGAGTMVGLIGRLGGTNPRIERFFLADDGEARRKAIAAALAEARKEAETIATAANMRLGPLISASDGSYGGPPQAIITPMAPPPPGPPPPPPPPPPIAVDLTPRPIETQARVTVAYQIIP